MNWEIASTGCSIAVGWFRTKRMRKSVETLRDIKIKLNLTNGWRKANPEEKGYTWSRE